jgi:antitoxin HicB
MSESPTETLLRPYAFVLTPQNPGYSAEILEFPGCFAQGETAEEAVTNLRAAAESWILALKAQGKSVPPPLTNYESRGQISLRLPGRLNERVRKLAAIDGVSVNQFITMCLCEAVGFRQPKSIDVEL